MSDRRSGSSWTQWVVLREEDGLPLDLFLTKQRPDLSRRKARAWIDTGAVRIGDKKIWISSYTLQSGDVVFACLPPKNGSRENLQQPALSTSDILFQNDLFLAISKPAGLPSQETRDPRRRSVPSELKRLLGESLFLCHRLDADTSGVLLLARTQAAATLALEAFRTRTTRKTYAAIVHGNSLPSLLPTFSVNLPLSALSQDTGRARVVKSGGKWALTHFTVLEKKGCFAYLQAHPITGRSHQIRLHLEAQGLALLGEKKYGPPLSHQALEMTRRTPEHHLLHAFSLEIVLGRQTLRIEAPFPPEFEQMLRQLHLRQCISS